MDDIEGPLHIAQECLYHREKRHGRLYIIHFKHQSNINEIFIIGIDLVHDNAEQSLLREIEVDRNSQEKMKALYKKVQEQLKNNRAAQHDLELDVRSKESALGIDTMCHQLNNYSKGINYYGGIEKFDPT